MSTITETKLLKDLRVADLKTELEKRGQVTSGVKAVLVERLQSLLKEDGLDPETYDFNEASCSDDCTKEEAKEENDAGIGRVRHDNRLQNSFIHVWVAGWDSGFWSASSF